MNFVLLGIYSSDITLRFIVPTELPNVWPVNMGFVFLMNVVISFVPMS